MAEKDVPALIRNCGLMVCNSMLKASEASLSNHHKTVSLVLLHIQSVLVSTVHRDFEIDQRVQNSQSATTAKRNLDVSYLFDIL